MHTRSLVALLLAALFPWLAASLALDEYQPSRPAEPFTEPINAPVRFFPSADRPFPGYIPARGVPSAVSGWSCTPASIPGPDPPDCPSVYGAWHDMGGSLRVPKGTCLSRTRGTCEARICAAGKGVELDAEEVKALAVRMMNPVQVKKPDESREGEAVLSNIDINVDMQGPAHGPTMAGSNSSSCSSRHLDINTIINQGCPNQLQPYASQQYRQHSRLDKPIDKMNKDATYTNVHLHRASDADLFEDFCKDRLPDDDVYVPPHLQPVNPEDEDDVVPDQHAAFGITKATQAKKESTWKDLGLGGLMAQGPRGGERRRMGGKLPR